MSTALLIISIWLILQLPLAMLFGRWLARRDNAADEHFPQKSFHQ